MRALSRPEGVPPLHILPLHLLPLHLLKWFGELARLSILQCRDHSVLFRTDFWRLRGGRGFTLPVEASRPGARPRPGKLLPLPLLKWLGKLARSLICSREIIDFTAQRSRCSHFCHRSDRASGDCAVAGSTTDWPATAPFEQRQHRSSRRAAVMPVPSGRSAADKPGQTAQFKPQSRCHASAFGPQCR